VIHTDIVTITSSPGIRTLEPERADFKFDPDITQIMTRYGFLSYCTHLYFATPAVGDMSTLISLDDRNQSHGSNF
jgi:hypothetical protein